MFKKIFLGVLTLFVLLNTFVFADVDTVLDTPETVMQQVEIVSENTVIDNHIADQLSAISANVANINNWVMATLAFFVILLSAFGAWCIWHFIILRILRRYIHFNI